MRLLYAVFVLSTAALVWAAFAIARTIRRHRRGEQRSGLGLGTEKDPPPDES